VALASLSSSFAEFVGNHGLYAVFGLMLIDAVLPAASELVMVSAGAIAAGAFGTSGIDVLGGRVSSPFWIFLTLSLAGTIGYTLGSAGGWALGLAGGRPLLERHGRKLHLTPHRLEQAERWFERRGDWAVFLGRLTPVVRSFISVPAGVFRMPFWPYLWLTLVGSAIWCFALAGVGWGFGSGYERFHHDFRYVEIAVVVALVAGVAWLLWRRRSSRLARADKQHTP